MSFFLSGVGATSGGVDNTELQETLKQVQSTLQEIEVLKNQTEQNNELVTGFDDRLTEYDTSTIKFKEV